MAPRIRSSTAPRDDKPEASQSSKRRRVGDPTNDNAPWVRPKLGVTKRAAEVERRESKKRAKVTSKRMKDEGKLTVFKGIPLDVLAEVTSFLSPIDILQLSRVSTNLRESFNPHTARHFWIDARRNVRGLPECPVDLNEAQYASLLFEKHCQACGTPGTHKTDFALRHRTCKLCHKELTKMGYSIVSSLSGEEPNRIVFRLVPPSCIDGIPDYTFHMIGQHDYNIRELTSVFEQYTRLNGSKAKQMRFMMEHEKLSRMMMETGRAMLKWHNDQEKQKEDEDRVKSELRVQQAKKRLLEIGWTQKDLDNADGTIDRYMYQPRELTPQIWKQSLPLIEYVLLNGRRIDRKKELEILWRPVLRKLVPNSEWMFVPVERDIVNLPCVRTLLERDNANVELTSQALQDVFPTVLKETRPHQDTVRRIFLREILESEEYTLPLPKGRKTRVRLLDKQISPDDPRLFYARHLFYCDAEGCNESDVMTLAMFYDHVQSKHYALDPKKWAVGFVESDTIQDSMKEILKVLELPQDVRVEDAERFEGRLQCGCDKQRRFGFVSLVQHFYDREPSKSHLPSKIPELVSVQ